MSKWATFHKVSLLILIVLVGISLCGVISIHNTLSRLKEDTRFIEEKIKKIEEVREKTKPWW